MNSASIMN